MVPIRRNALDGSTVAAAVSEIDQRLRRSVSEMWLLLPADRRTLDELNTQIRRLVDRALEDFAENRRQFPVRSEDQE